MRIVLLSQWYRPEPEPKVHVLGRDLVARGHEVTAITGLPNYPSGRIYDGYRLRPWPQVEVVEGVRVVRVPLYADHSRSALRRVLNYASFAAAASVFGPWMTGPADVMWVYHPPLTVALPAMVIAAARRVPFVYEVLDMWPETLGATGMFRSTLGLRMVGGLADLVYRRAARITVPSPGFKRNLVAKGVPEQKIDYMPNWADEEVYRPLPPDPFLRRELGLEGKFLVLYAGNIGAAQRLGNLLEAAELLRDLPDLQIVLLGGGVEREELQARARAKALANVTFLPTDSPDRVASVTALAEVLLTHLRRDPLFEITIPSKTISYLACGKSILAVAEGDAAEVVVDAKAGLVCPPDDPAALAKAMRLMYKMPAERRRELGQAGREYFLANFSRAQLFPRYEKLLTETAALGRRRV